MRPVCREQTGIMLNHSKGSRIEQKRAGCEQNKRRKLKLSKDIWKAKQEQRCDNKQTVGKKPVSLSSFHRSFTVGRCGEVQTQRFANLGICASFSAQRRGKKDLKKKKEDKSWISSGNFPNIWNAVTSKVFRRNLSCKPQETKDHRPVRKIAVKSLKPSDPICVRWTPTLFAQCRFCFLQTGLKQQGPPQKGRPFLSIELSEPSEQIWTTLQKSKGICAPKKQGTDSGKTLPGKSPLKTTRARTPQT